MTRMKQRRQQLGLTQTVLAARAGRLAPSDISRFETGRQVPYPGQTKRIARVLGLTPAELLDDVASSDVATA
jgi:transcriptional regulator with XRE-family HTH domain